MNYDQNGNPIPDTVHFQAVVTQGGDGNSLVGHVLTQGTPVDTAIVSIKITSPDSQIVVGRLMPQGNGIYTISLVTALTGNYNVDVIASDNVPKDTLNNSQFILTTKHSFFVSPTEQPKEITVSLPQYAVFANHNITFGTSTKIYDGKVGSNGDINIGGSSSIEQGVEGNGSFSGGTSINAGPITFNGSISLSGSSHITGNINGGSSLQGGTSCYIKGNIITGDFMKLGGSTNVSGNLDAGGNVTLGTSAKILGNLTTSGTLSKSTSSVVYGTVTENGVPAIPQTYISLNLPPTSSFSSGGNDITINSTLNPGSYGKVNLGTSKTLNLSSGDYYFTSFSMGGSGKLNMDVNGGKIRIFVTGDVKFGTSVTTAVLNGGPESVYLETEGNFTLGGSDKWNGTVYTPAGNITVGTSCLINGALLANGNISIGGSTKIYYKKDSEPEKSTISQNNEKAAQIVPDKIALEQNFPNPFNPTTTINYQLPEKNYVTLKIYDILGNQVKTLVDQEVEAGYHSVRWNASGLASGVYFCRLNTGSFVSTKKLLLLK